jgi:pimeloyl-ACP methyl ester carboxylesterase
MSLQGVILDRPEGGILKNPVIKKLVAIVASTLMLVTVAGCTPAPEVPRDLASYQSQVLDWNKCADSLLLPKGQRSDIFNTEDVDCATVLAPAVYTGSQTTQDFKIQLMRLSEASGQEPVGTIFINPGGPGGSGVEQLQWSAFPAELLAKFDVIGFDPRGVGASTLADGKEIKCSDKLDYATYFLGEPTPANEQEARSNDEPSDAYYKDCSERNPLWWTLSTDHVVDDLELLRSVVTGDQALNFIGTSYGTTIAGMYVTKYPERVGKIVLDSPTTVDDDSVESAIVDAKAMEKRLENYLAEYAKHAKITKEQAWERLLEIRQLADDDKIYGFAGIKPGPQDLGMISSEALLTRGILALSYMPEADAIVEFNAALDDLYNYSWNGRFEWYGFNLDGYDANKLEGSSLNAKKFVRSNEFEIMSIVNTMDYSPEPESAAEREENYKLIKAAAPKWHQLGSDASGYVSFDESDTLSWDSIAREDSKIPDPPTKPLARSNDSGKQLLIIGATREAVTPFSFSEDTAKLLKSPLIAVDSATHGPAAGYNIPCLNKVLLDFFTTDKAIKSQSCPGN